MAHASVRLERDACVATITLDRPSVRNALDDASVGQLLDALRSVERDPVARVLKLAGTGSCFCAGVDLRTMRDMGRAPEAENLESSRRFARMLEVLHSLSKPTVALVQGPAIGGGVGMVACCDFAVASTAAFFRLSEVRLGLIPAMVGPFLVEALGARAARKLMLSAERVDADRALGIGLVDEVCPPENLGQRAGEIVDRLLLGAPGAQAACKSLVQEIAGAPLDGAIHDRTASVLARQRASAEGRAGVQAFLQKRKPPWARPACRGGEQ